MASSTVKPQNGFGKRGGGQRAVKAAQQNSRSKSPADAKAREFRYTKKLSIAGFLIFAPFGEIFIGFSGYGPAYTMLTDPGALQRVPHLIGFIIIGCLGMFWFVQGLRGGLALKVTPKGYSATTFYGAVAHDWKVLGRIAVQKKPTFLQSKFLSLFGASTGALATTLTLYPETTWASWSKTPIEVRVSDTDETLEDMIDAIAKYRPDLTADLAT